MRPLFAAELLDIWEQGLLLQPVQRALALLDVACPELALDDLASLSIGQRNILLSRLREWTFGSQLASVTTCPDCGERLELNLRMADIQSTAPGESPEALSLRAAGCQVEFRLPNSLDMIALPDQVDAATARQQLLQRCLLAVTYDNEDAATDQLPAEVVERVVAEMEHADPHASVTLALTCPVCDYQWEACFDILKYFWSEIHDWAHRILQEVHVLASAYGWSERDILAMSPWRRQVYLEMARR